MKRDVEILLSTLKGTLAEYGMLPSSGVSTSSRSRWLKPYITGWGIARAVMDGTELAADNELEPNFYRHPKRQGKPEDTFDIEHDLI